jgi:hypothetical protein
LYPIPLEVVRARVLQGSQASDSGPDLALLEIPQAFMPRILAHKSALNLSSQRDRFLAKSFPEDALWAVTGISEALSDVRSLPDQSLFEAIVRGRAFFGGIDQAHELHGWDYLDVGADISLEGVPNTFGGVSGGGLWQVQLAISETGQLSWNGERRFNGVAFWQSSVQGDRRVIRCHGPKGLFTKAWTQLSGD